MTEAIHTKLFLGLLVKGEIKTALQQSFRWKENLLLHQEKIVSIQFQNREYIGFYVQFPFLYSQLEKTEQELKTLVQAYCPKIHLEQHKVYLFSQLFLA